MMIVALGMFCGMLPRAHHTLARDLPTHDQGLTSTPKPSIRKEIPPSKRERAILGDVTDGTRHFDEPAVYLLLEWVAAESIETAAVLPELVERHTLIDESTQRRGAPVLVRAVFVRSASIRLRNRVRFNGPVYGSILSNPTNGEPLQALTLDAPEGLRMGDRVEVAGYYLKYRRDSPAKGAGDDVLVPIVVGRKLVRQARANPPAGVGNTEQLVVVVVALAVIYYLVRRWANRNPRSPRQRKRGVTVTECHDPPVDLDALGQSSDRSE